MGLPTLVEILNDLIEALGELIEALKREAAEQGLIDLQGNMQMRGFETTIWTPVKSNTNTAPSDLAALSVAQLDDWLTQNREEIERIM